jgi:hypothetical protein
MLLVWYLILFPTTGVRNWKIIWGTSLKNIFGSNGYYCRIAIALHLNSMQSVHWNIFCRITDEILESSGEEPACKVSTRIIMSFKLVIPHNHWKTESNSFSNIYICKSSLIAPQKVRYFSIVCMVYHASAIFLIPSQPFEQLTAFRVICNLYRKTI